MLTLEEIHVISEELENTFLLKSPRRLQLS